MNRILLRGCLAWAGLVGQALTANPATPTLCPRPATEPAWLQDFSEAQKKSLSVEWEPVEGKPQGRLKFEGEYVESEAGPPEYEEYEHKSEIEAAEVWTCGGESAEFKSIAGKVETTVEWEKKAPEGEETFESEDRFEIRSLQDYRQVAHESDHSLEIETPQRQKTVRETKSWKQTWDEKDHPTVLGTLHYEEDDKVTLPASSARQLASVQIPGFETAPLPPGRTLITRTEKHGKFNGPLEPLMIEMTQDVQHLQGERLIEKKTIKGRQKGLYPYDEAKKSYQFERLDFWHEEESKDFEKNVAFSLHRWESWLDPQAQSPNYTSFWKYTTRKTKFGGSTEFIIKSDGHGILPHLFHMKSKNGALTRTSDYSSGGRMIRFLVIYYPAQGNNIPLIDLKFSEFGKMESLLLDDGTNEIDGYEDPFNDPAALYTLQQRINAVKELESMRNVRYFPLRSTRDADYPQVYQAPPSKQ